MAHNIIKINLGTNRIKEVVMWKTLIYNDEHFDNFQINTEGIVRSVKTNVEYANYVGKMGYVLCSLPQGKRGSCKNIRIHKALAETYLSNPNNYPVVHHIDENKTNNDLSNLEWVSYKTNTNEHWKKESLKKQLFNNRKLTTKQIKEIKENKQHLSYKTLANLYSVSKTTINNVIKNIYYNGV